MSLFYKVCVITRSNNTEDTIQFHVWTKREYNNFMQAMREDIERQFYTVLVSRENNNILVEIDI